MVLQDLMDVSLLSQHIENGVVSQRQHPNLPLRILNYTPKASFTRTWDEVTVQCRGLIIDNKDQVVSRCMPKFWNLGQEGFTLSVNRNVVVDSELLLKCAREWNSGLTITRKMDGQCGILHNYGDQWGISTRGSFESEGAKFATEKFQKFVKYGATDFIPKGWTLIFEVIDKSLRIVIPYDWSGLCLLTAVNNETGEEMSYEALHEMWTNLNSYSKTLNAEGVSVQGKPWCRIVEKFDITLDTAVADEDKEEEGYVISVNHKGYPSLKSKVKLDEYCRLHRILTNMTPQMLWAEMATPLKPLISTDAHFNHKTGETEFSMPVPPEFRAWVQQWQRGMMAAFHENLVKAIKAQQDLYTWEWGISEMRPEGRPTSKFKNDKERKEWLLSPNGGSVPRDIVNAALLLSSGKIVNAYECLWDLARPHGREEHFFNEGQGE